MFSTSLKKDFIAQHRFDQAKGPEGQYHSHHFAAEVTVFGNELDPTGYLVDLDDLDKALRSILLDLSDRPLNEVPGMEDRPPSIENLAKFICDRLTERMDLSGLRTVNVRIWESERASASFQQGGSK